MSTRRDHYRTTFECVDKNPEFIPGLLQVLMVLFYHVEASCTGMPCAPYDPQKELTCEFAPSKQEHFANGVCVHYR